MAPDGYAQTSPTRTKREQKTTVVVSNLFQLMESSTNQQSISPLRQSVTSYLATHKSTFNLVPDAQLRRRLLKQKLFKDRLELATSLATEGIQSYREQKFAQAITRLEKALKQYDAINYDVIGPRVVARMILYLALSYMEQDVKLPQTMVLIRRMIVLDPTLVLKKGYYADKIVDIYEQQRRTLMREMAQQRPGLELVERARFLSQVTGADAVVMGFVRPNDNQFTVSLYVYLTRESRFERGESVTISSLEANVLRMAGDRLMSRYATCFQRPVRITVGPAPSRGKSPFSLSLRFAYATFLIFPERIEDTYDNVGMGIGMRWLLTKEFGMVGGVDVLFGRKDRSDYTINDYHPLYRGFFGGELGIELWRLRLSMQLAGEVSHMADFQIWGNKECAKKPDCGDPRRINYDTYGLMLGLNARPMVSLKMLDSLKMFGAVNTTFFFYTGEEREFNFPLGGELGLEYRF